MANDEQLKILLQGITIWNKWRAENPNDQIDLLMADLSGADLSDANLIRTDLSKAHKIYSSGQKIVV